MNRFIFWGSVLSASVILAGTNALEQVEADEEGGFYVDGQPMGTVSSEWGLEPLGEAGTLKISSAFARSAEYRPRPQYAAGALLCGGARPCAVVIDPNDAAMQPLGQEVAAHLAAISGQNSPLVFQVPAGPAVVLKWLTGSDERMSVKTEGNKVYLAGNGAGLNHAVTYFLEALGCRYLWPGKLGKVVPKRQQVFAPVIDFSSKPAFRVRAMRGGPIPAPKTKSAPKSRGAISLNRLGIEPEALRVAFNAAYEGNEIGVRSFYAWHGILDSEECQVVSGYSRASLKEGHYFKGFTEKYAKTHPEYFALQRSGTRDPAKVGGVERPCFCYSNPDFIRATAAEVIHDFKGRYRYRRATPISPPDGGSMRPCMCANCRRLDPKNAPKIPYTFPNPATGKTETSDYPSMTDRMLYFSNAVLEEVRKVFPERGLTFYPYSYYCLPPVKVMPNKGLVPFSVAGNYTDTRKWKLARENVAAWINMGLECYWRPNVLNGWRPSGPQNFSRFIYEDIETMKANGLKGCEFDCVSGSWGAKGLDFYMTARAQLNPDGLSYEEQLDDYCRAGYGAAASAVKRYFLAVERMNRAAAEQTGKRGAQEYDFRRAIAAKDYASALDAAELKALLAEAKSAAGADAVIAARLRHLEIAVVHGEYNHRLANCAANETQAIQAEYAQFIRDTAIAVPMAVTPYDICFYSPFMCTYSYQK